MAIKIIKQGNFDDSFPKEITCDNCESLLSFDKNDAYIGVLGAYHIKCPNCGYENMLDVDGLTLTKDNLRFPVHYFKPSKDAVKIDDDEIDKWVRECITHLRERDDFVSFTGCGDTMVFVFKMDGDEEYYVYVGKKGYETHVPFEDIDYEN